VFKIWWKSSEEVNVRLNLIDIASKGVLSEDGEVTPENLGRFCVSSR